MFSFLNSTLKQSTAIYILILLFLHISSPSIFNNNLSQLSWLMVIIAILSYFLSLFIFKK